MIYDEVETNKGSGYDATTGIFTAPVEGTYVFIWQVVTQNSGIGYCDLDLYKNGSRHLIMSRADSRGRVGGTSDAASNSAVLTLNTGDTVGIRAGSCDYVYGRPYTSFSGFKI